MKIIDEINQALDNFLKQQVIFGAQVKALQNQQSKKVNESFSRAYLLHIIKILNTHLNNGKLTAEGKEKAVAALNPSGDIIEPIRLKTVSKRDGVKNKIQRNSKEDERPKGKTSVKPANEKKGITKSKKEVREKQILDESPTKEFLIKYTSLTLQEIADELKLSVSTIQHLLKRKKLEKKETDKLTSVELHGIYGLIISRLKAFKRKEKAERLVLHPGVKKANKSLNKSDGVFDKIHKAGGLGKVIYTRMKG